MLYILLLISSGYKKKNQTFGFNRLYSVTGKGSIICCLHNESGNWFDLSSLVESAQWGAAPYSAFMESGTG